MFGSITKVAQEGLPGLEIVGADKNANHNSGESHADGVGKRQLAGHERLGT